MTHPEIGETLSELPYVSFERIIGFPGGHFWRYRSLVVWDRHSGQQTLLVGDFRREFMSHLEIIKENSGATEGHPHCDHRLRVPLYEVICFAQILRAC